MPPPTRLDVFPAKQNTIAQIDEHCGGGMPPRPTKGMSLMTPEQLVSLAKEAMGHAYAPYSGYSVGAALLCADGTVYQGCNIENASYTPTICAERTAIFKAVYDGHRNFVAIAVCGGKDGVITGAFPPCGVCRQVMREFCEDDFLIYMVTPEGYEAHTLAEILPFSFSAKKHMQ